MPAKGAYLLIAGGGAILLWSGVRGKSWSTVLRDVVSGQNPTKAPNTNPIQTASSPPAAGAANLTTAGGSQVAPSQVAAALVNGALKYIGHAYVYGGAPGPQAQQPWDCSSFMNYDANVVVGLSIPGYGPHQWNTNTHGPATGVWIMNPPAGSKRVASNLTPQQAQNQALPGDILVDPTHMGIAIGNNQMCSALNPAKGTATSAIVDTMLTPTYIIRYS